MSVDVCPHCGESCCAAAASERRRLLSVIERLVEWDTGKPYLGLTPALALKDIVRDARELKDECP